MKNLYNILNPLDQFEIKDIISLSLPIFNNLKINITNLAVYLILSIMLIFLKVLLVNNKKIVYNK
jgi:F-type H+-transporting ATPase subunit a